jgi:hypothetical protein
MAQKFYLNKILKIDNIEYYSLESLNQIKKSYDKFLEDSGGTDPDFPTLNLGAEGKRVKGTNVYSIFGDDENFKGISEGLPNDKLI